MISFSGSNLVGSFCHSPLFELRGLSFGAKFDKRCNKFVLFVRYIFKIPLGASEVVTITS